MKSGIRKTQEEFEYQFYNLFSDTEYKILGEYKNSKTKIQIFHFGCGNVFERIPAGILSTKKVFCDCKRKNIKYTKEKFINNFYIKNDCNKYEILSEYKESKNTDQIIKIKCLLCGDIFKRRATLSLKGIRCNCQMKIYKVDNENYFENIDTQLKSYFLGFIMADGSVENFSSKLLRIKINNIDEDILVKLSEELGTNHIIENKPYRKGKTFSQLRINNKKIFDDLGKYGIVPNKTYKVEPPNIKNDLLRYYYLGLWDGDGGICYTITHNKYKPDYKNYNIYLTGTKRNVYGFNKMLLDNNLVDKIYKVHPASKDGEIVKINIGGNRQVMKIMSFMYNDSQYNLARKYNKYLELCKELRG